MRVPRRLQYSSTPSMSDVIFGLDQGLTSPKFWVKDVIMQQGLAWLHHLPPEA